MFKKKVDNILIIKADGLAAFVAAEPSFDAIRRAHPDARISLLTQGHLQRVARASSYFDQVAGLPDLRDSEARTALVKQLKSAKFSCIYDLASNDESRRLQAAMISPFGPKWHSAGPAVRNNKKRRAVTDYIPNTDKVLASSGVDVPERLPDFHWALSARKDSANMQPSWFGISGPFGLLMPTLDDVRRWPVDRYSGLASKMAKEGLMPVMVGQKELHSFADEVSHSAPEIVDLTGKADHLQLVALAQEAAFFVSDAAEEVHLAVSVGCAGVLIKKQGEENLAPSGRHIMTLTTEADLGEVSADFVWRSLDNMGLIPREALRSAANVR